MWYSSQPVLPIVALTLQMWKMPCHQNKANCRKSKIWLQWKEYLLHNSGDNQQRKSPSTGDIICKIRLAAFVSKPLQNQNPWSYHERNASSFHLQTVTIKRRSCPTVNQPQQQCAKYCFQISTLQIRFFSNCNGARILLVGTTPLFLMLQNNMNFHNYHSKHSFSFCSISFLKTILYITIAYILCLHPVL